MREACSHCCIAAWCLPRGMQEIIVMTDEAAEIRQLESSIALHLRQCQRCLGIWFAPAVKVYARGIGGVSEIAQSRDASRLRAMPPCIQGPVHPFLCAGCATLGVLEWTA